MRDLRLKHVAILFSFLLLACQDTELETENPVDQDMEEALALAGEFLQSARSDATDSDVTVIKYKSDLLFKTNTIAGGYDAISETTVTAESMEGGYVFWHAGGGVKKLIAIEMDEDSQEALGSSNVPFEIVQGHYWALWIPYGILDDYEEDDEDFHLKYDIVYETNSGEIVRLDPKIQIKGEEQ